MRGAVIGGMAAALLIGVGAGAAGRSPVRVTGLRCEYLPEPLGIESPRPRLQWLLESKRRGERQSAYQVLVASSESALKDDRGDLWDSGRVASDQQAQVKYGGRPLRAAQRCWWKVRVWDAAGNPSAWSPTATWEMGLLAPSDWRGRWIGSTEETAQRPAPLFRKEFTVRGRVRRARAYVCGLGYHELRLNGEKVGDHWLDPGYTRYDRRALYVTHDVTKQLKQGRNALGAMLGTGWFNVHTVATWYFDKAPWRQAPKLLLDLRIEYVDGRTETVATDETWKTADGPVTFDSIYAGESYDARKELPGWDRAGFNDSGWSAARLVKAPGGVISSQTMPPIRIVDTLTPVRMTEPKPGVYVFDMGQNLSGHALLTVSGPAGSEVRLKYGERLHKDGTLDQYEILVHQHPFQRPAPPKEGPYPRFQEDRYTLKGEGTEKWEARFTYHGFQYVEVTGFPGRPSLESVKARVTHTDVEPAGTFECSHPLLNKIQKATRWAYLSNLASIPTDCPHREKNGWTGDAHLAANQAMFNFFPPAVYDKWIQDISDEMRPTGEVPGIVPSSGWGYEWGNGPAWDSAFVLIPWYQYEQYGDTRILAKNYDKMRRYVDYLTSRAKDGIVSIGLGDWVPPGKTAPTEVTSTGYYYADADIVARAAELLGKRDDARKYRALAESIKAAFNRKFLNPETGIYSNGTQTALATPLNWGLAPASVRDRVLANLVAEVEKKNGHLDTGILGTKYLLNVLLDGGRADVAYRIATQTTYPSWGKWFEDGATTLWEQWDGGASRNHIMFGDISAWFYQALAGIRSAEPGFRRIIIRPQVVGDLTAARATYDSIRGRIVSDWKVENGRFKLDVTIPPNATAAVYLPTGDPGAATEGGRPVAGREDIKRSGAALEIGSGTYRFEAPLASSARS